ncbi:MarR family transcriptional regulator [Kitasatospora sp. MMS16-BH015]|uniref:MarR family winged helix-turn-helix transcriptional regulator n=1 Tax=Kitasatospora sp. MMS16-BH015 TaxID=2018025 RepID=UPI000CA38AD8|nr:MarR family transcriptional regulator [Kitasatospora sp. MMS16-BH015]AUG75956.1 MarR family transcriptional regulator [Kitasatospora sp. MMS16-BH015]
MNVNIPADETRPPSAEAEDPTVQAATRIWAAMSGLVLEHGDRRKQVSDALGLSFARAKALRRLVPGPLTMRELGAKLTSDKAYTTLIVDDLEERGLVERTVHPEDRRCKLVTLTAPGRAAAARADRILARPPAAMLTLPPADLATLERLLTVLREGED